MYHCGSLYAGGRLPVTWRSGLLESLDRLIGNTITVHTARVPGTQYLKRQTSIRV